MQANSQLLVLIAGEQAAPNLLTIQHLQPGRVIILHSKFAKSVSMANNLKLLMGRADTETELHEVDEYDVQKVREKVAELIQHQSPVIVNVTGGTKPMSLGALEAARNCGAQPLYVRSQDGKTLVDFYRFDNDLVGIQHTVSLNGTISLNDYITSYFGDSWKEVGFGGDGIGKAFEMAVYNLLTECTDEVISGWRDNSNQVDMDFVFRCNNQIGIVQAKTGKEALKLEGIKQLLVGGDQRFFGTYAKRFLVINRKWGKNEKNKFEFCQETNITVVELPSFVSETSRISAGDRQHFIQAVEGKIGKPHKGSQP